MDLRDVLNNSDKDAAPKPSRPSQPPPTTTHQQSPAQQQQQQYRDYPPGPQPHQSPGGPPPREHPPQSQYHQQAHQHQQHGGQYPQQQQQQQAYGTPGTYPRAQPPPLQTPGSYHQDSRSPSGSMHAPSASPYPRSAATPGAGPHSAMSYFPQGQTNQEMSSPAARHQQYPPPTQQQQHHQHQRQESYPHSAGPYGGVPQTPPVGAAHPYGHQRGPSAHSSPTPTSAHSSLPPQQQQHQQHRYDAVHSSASQTPYGRPQSQPPTPGGGPPPGAQTPGARASGIISFDDRNKPQQHHPSSPFQQRNSQHAPPPPQNLQLHQQSSVQSAQSVQSIHGAQPHVSPHQHSQPLIQRSSTSYEAHANEQQHHHQSRQQSLREDSEPVSPKTRVHSLQSQHEEIDRRQTYPQTMATESSNTPAKRKMEDRDDVSPHESQSKHARSEANGQQQQQQQRGVKQESPAVPRKQRMRRAVPPRWAQSVEILKGGLPKHPNYIMQPRVHAKPTAKPVNGKASRHPSPEAARQSQSQAHQAPPPRSSSEPRTEDILRPWEPSLTGRKPFEEATKILADEFFNNIIRVPDLREIQSLGIKFEIEAKLGELLDRRTNSRVDMGLRSECILDERAQIFRSSMSEDVHKRFNEFLNDCVVKSHPQKTQHPSSSSRIKIDYKHRRETDRFYDLPPELLPRLPTCIRSRFSHGKRPRVRVTHDSKTGELLGSIVKARVCDIDLHMPNAPMDCRVSVNLEMDWEGGVEELLSAQGQEKQSDRNKDRLSYVHGHYQVDLTQVTQVGPQGPKKEHELEIELSADMILDQGNKVLAGQNHRYSELIDGFLDNVRLLARKAGEWQR